MAGLAEGLRENMRRSNRTSRLLPLLALLAMANDASAQRLIDYIRNYDLNDYALGLSFSGSQNPYLGGENSIIAYPVLTSFRDSALTNDWLLIREGDLGIRWVSQSQWELGVVGRIQTLGFGTTDSPELAGLDDRQWGLEMGPIVGYRKWPVHINFKTYYEILGRHGGTISHLALSLPIEHARGYLVPQVEVISQSADYTNYYFGVAPHEARRFRPEYKPGSAFNRAMRVRWGWALADKWLLYGTVGLELLDEEITNSPIVDRDDIWSASIALAYNNDIFQPRITDTPPPEQPKFEFRVGAFLDNVDSRIVRDADNGRVGDEIDVENLLGLPEEETLLHAEALYRIGYFHRLEMGYLKSSRSGTTTLQRSIDFGDRTFPEGTTVDSRLETRVVRFAYAYSLINDPQKEIGVMGGVHLTEFDTIVADSVSGEREITNATTPLPVIGLHGGLSLGSRASLGARIQVFRMDFHRYEGSLNFATSTGSGVSAKT